MPAYRFPFTATLNLPLLSHNDASVFTGRLFLRLDTIGMQEGAELSLGTAREAVRQSKFRRTEGIADVTQSINGQISRLNEQAEIYQAVGALLARLDAFKQAMDTLSEVRRQIDQLIIIFLISSRSIPSSPLHGHWPLPCIL